MGRLAKVLDTKNEQSFLETSSGLRSFVPDLVNAKTCKELIILKLHSKEYKENLPILYRNEHTLGLNYIGCRLDYVGCLYKPSTQAMIAEVGIHRAHDGTVVQTFKPLVTTTPTPATPTAPTKRTATQIKSVRCKKRKSLLEAITQANPRADQELIQRLVNQELEQYMKGYLGGADHRFKAGKFT
jgi:hypothetical protein